MSLHVVFKVGNADYVLPASEVSEMESFTGATKIPGTAAYVAGIVQIRGKVIPLVDLRARFGLPAIERGLDARVIVVRNGDRLVGLLADCAREVIKIEDESFKPPPKVVVEQSEGFVSSVAQAGARLVLRMDFAKVIGHDAVGATGSQEEKHGDEA